MFRMIEGMPSALFWMVSVMLQLIGAVLTQVSRKYSIAFLICTLQMPESVSEITAEYPATDLLLKQYLCFWSRWILGQ